MDKVTVELSGCPIGEPNHNGRVYSREVVEKMVEQMKSMTKDGRLNVCMEVTHPSPSPDRLSDIEGSVKDVEFDGEAITLEITPIPGKCLDQLPQEVIDSAMFTPSGQATVKQDAEGHTVVQDDYLLQYIGLSVNKPE